MLLRQAALRLRVFLSLTIIWELITPCLNQKRSKQASLNIIHKSKLYGRKLNKPKLKYSIMIRMDYHLKGVFHLIEGIKEVFYHHLE